MVRIKEKVVRYTISEEQLHAMISLRIKKGEAAMQSRMELYGWSLNKRQVALIEMRDYEYEGKHRRNKEKYDG